MNDGPPPAGNDPSSIMLMTCHPLACTGPVVLPDPGILPPGGLRAAPERPSR